MGKQKIQKDDGNVAYKFPAEFLDLNEQLKKLFFKPTPTTVVEDQIIVVDHFIPVTVCDLLIKTFETGLKLETTPLVKSKGYAVRVNDRVSLPNSYGASQSLWLYLNSILSQGNEYEYEDDDNDISHTFQDAIGLNPQLRVYRYRKGHHFGKHYDEAVTVDKPKGKTKWTLLIYLTGDDEFEGGGTIFYPRHNSKQGLNIHPKKGMALLHKHGDDCLQHEAEMVKSGEKWVLRSDVVF
ncbi:uncharacterized protein KQ657_003306 [Scheffersomyces spartinae]|uniref:Fe2OG dioxygenase domain-containing protein n=1 Tax=Scheffersomyces spartinae TaxID=45513 RepID=A0A9P8AK72_9ASCO|nr:uncharacterized protein KQ657_003306 [Scheffersomyces spartinae]KAG7195543.1 hypothetical protein KQ657_003306 [Scheffersomyces spartinae]